MTDRNGPQIPPPRVPSPVAAPQLETPAFRRRSRLANTQTLENLRRAFAREAQANRLYLYFAQKAQIEGYNDLAALMRETAEGETGHALGHMEFLEEEGDPVNGAATGNTDANLKVLLAIETQDAEQEYPAMAARAREEGFEDIAQWFETLARAEAAHVKKLTKALETFD